MEKIVSLESKWVSEKMYNMYNNILKFNEWKCVRKNNWLKRDSSLMTSTN